MPSNKCFLCTWWIFVCAAFYGERYSRFIRSVKTSSSLTPCLCVLLWKLWWNVWIFSVWQRRQGLKLKGESNGAAPSQSASSVETLVQILPSNTDIFKPQRSSPPLTDIPLSRAITLSCSPSRTAKTQRAPGREDQTQEYKTVNITRMQRSLLTGRRLLTDRRTLGALVGMESRARSKHSLTFPVYAAWFVSGCVRRLSGMSVYKRLTGREEREGCEESGGEREECGEGENENREEVWHGKTSKDDTCAGHTDTCKGQMLQDSKKLNLWNCNKIKCDISEPEDLRLITLKNTSFLLTLFLDHVWFQQLTFVSFFTFFSSFFLESFCSGI